jgi:hypothetical protein
MSQMSGFIISSIIFVLVMCIIAAKSQNQNVAHLQAEEEQNRQRTAHEGAQRLQEERQRQAVAEQKRLREAYEAAQRQQQAQLFSDRAIRQQPPPRQAPAAEEQRAALTKPKTAKNTSASQPEPAERSAPTAKVEKSGVAASMMEQEAIEAAQKTRSKVLDDYYASYGPPDTH